MKQKKLAELVKILGGQAVADALGISRTYLYRMLQADNKHLVTKQKVNKVIDDYVTLLENLLIK